jgi:hypothetical protein
MMSNAATPSTVNVILALIERPQLFVSDRKLFHKLHETAKRINCTLSLWLIGAANTPKVY